MCIRDSHVLIDAAWGLGEAVVSGVVDSDRYRVFKAFLDDERLVPIVERSLGRKRLKIVNSTDESGDGPTMTVDTTNAERNQLVLDDPDLLTLARWAVIIENHYGRPMDIEWAKDGVTGELFIVQARPETVQARQSGAILTSYEVSNHGPQSVSYTHLDVYKRQILEWDKYIYIPMGVRVAIPNLARGCPFTCSFCSQWKFWRDYRIRDPKKVVDEIESLVRDHGVGFFILADEEPTIHRKKFIQFCEELIARDLGVLWGINTRVTDILRDQKLLPMFRKAGLIHVSLGTEAAAQLKLDRFNKETTIAQNKKAIQLLREAGIVTEAQFIVGLENETAETLEETYQMARDWNPDMANWAMYTPWPFSDLFQELGDKVEVFDFEKYNFVTPIMKPDAMERGELLDRVMHNLSLIHI